MEKRYGIVTCALLLWLGIAPVHSAQAQKENREVPSEKVKKQQNEAQQVVYGYFISQGGMSEEAYKALLRKFKAQEALDYKGLAASEATYRSYFHYLEGEQREKAIVNTIRNVKKFIINGRMREISAEIQVLEKKAESRWFEKWIDKLTKK